MGTTVTQRSRCTCDQMFSVTRAFLLQRKCQQVAAKRHLWMVINYSLTDVAKCLQKVGSQRNQNSVSCCFHHGQSNAASLKHMQTYSVHLVWFHIIIHINFQVYLNPVKSHIQMCCARKLSGHFKAFGFDWREKFLKRILKRLLQIYTIKTTVLEQSLKGIIWRQEVSWPDICEQAQSATVQTSFKVMCTQTLLPPCWSAKESQWVSACRGLTDYNHILIKPRLQYWILGTSTENN